MTSTLALFTMDEGIMITKKQYEEIAGEQQTAPWTVLLQHDEVEFFGEYVMVTLEPKDYMTKLTWPMKFQYVIWDYWLLYTSDQFWNKVSPSVFRLSDEALEAKPKPQRYDEDFNIIED